MLRNKKKTKIIVTVCIVLILLALLLPLLLSVNIYQSNFGGRYETAPWMMRNLDEFNGLNREQYSFNSNDGQNLIGYKYYKESDDVKGVIIIAHGFDGGGGGHNTYMDIADYFTTNGYIVFAYDATGNDESEGDSVRGIPQGLIDLDYAVQFIKSNAEFEGLPIMLFGHSWGAYASGTVLNFHTDIKAVVMVAGFNKSADMIEKEGRRIAGDGIKIILPYIPLIEKIKFGKYSSYSCFDGFEASDAGVMVIHSVDDDMISFENQFMRFFGIYQNNPRFVFVEYENRGHDYVYYSDDSKEHRNEYNKQFEEYVNSVGAEINSDLKTEYMNENGDKSALFELDTELMDRIVSFYDNYSK